MISTSWEFRVSPSSLLILSCRQCPTENSLLVSVTGGFSFQRDPLVLLLLILAAAFDAYVHSFLFKTSSSFGFRTFLSQFPYLLSVSCCLLISPTSDALGLSSWLCSSFSTLPR